MQNHPQKQLVYPDLNSRIISTMIDMIIFMLICIPIQQVLNRLLFNFFIAGYHNITFENVQTVLTQEILERDKSLYNALTEYVIALFLISFSLIFAYYILFWNYFGYTPGKYFFRMQIVDEITMGKPKLSKLIRRFLLYTLAPISLVYILIDKKRRGLHDKLSGTLVISK